MRQETSAPSSLPCILPSGLVRRSGVTGASIVCLSAAAWAADKPVRAWPAFSVAIAAACVVAVLMPAASAQTPDPYGTGHVLNIMGQGSTSTATKPAATTTGTATAPAQTAPGAAAIPPPLFPSTAPGAAVQIPGAPGAVLAPGAAASAAPVIRPQPPQYFDYSANLLSDVFGANLFTGAFAREGATQFNPDYAVAVGDQLQVRLWGAFQFEAALTVDPKGNIFLPHVGPVQVLGVRNQELQRTVESAVSKVFRTNVFSYASLSAAQPVRIFVGGFVHRPGLYSGTSMDSLLHFLDQAGGIDPERGSFLNVQVRRAGQTRATVNLYEFLLEGRMPVIQLADGDVIFTAPRQNTVKVSGLAENAKRFEFSDRRTVADIIRIARPHAPATHVRVVRNVGTVKDVEYYALQEAGGVPVRNGDELIFTADQKPGTITVRIEGEHQSAQEYVLPYGAKLGDLISKIELSDRSDAASIQLFRLSVKDRQRLMLQVALKSLETAVLTARSGTSDEARLRKEEAELIMQWVERAKSIEPSGQVLIAQAAGRNELLLENGDVLRIPTRAGLVMVSGEVLFPNAIAFDPALGLDDYVRRAGGYTQQADAARVVVAHPDGSFSEVSSERGFFSAGNGDVRLRAGDQILVLPKIEVKSRQIAKDLTQILFQIAVAAKVVLGL